MSAGQPPQVTRRKIRRALSLVFVLVAVAAGAAVLLKPQPPIDVETVRVAKGEIRELVPSAASGEVKPLRRVTVRSEIAGTVAKVGKRRGDRVASGELVVVFDADELGARLDQAKANVTASDVTRAMAKTRRDTARRAAERAKKLISGGAISPAELDRATSELEAADQAIAQADASHLQAKAAEKLARLAVDRAHVRAPYAGVLQDVEAEVGVQVGIGGPLFDLIDDSDVYVEVPVDEGDASRIRVGQAVILRVDAGRSDQLRGKVRFIPPAVGKSSGASILEPGAVGRRDRFVYIEVQPDEGAAFRVGASVNAEFLISSKADVLWVPTHAVIGRGVERSVYVVEGDRIRQQRFRPGLTSWERTEILSNLEEGTAVIATLNIKGLADGVRVRPAPAAEAK